MMEWVVVYTRLEEESVRGKLSKDHRLHGCKLTGVIMHHGSYILARRLNPVLPDDLKFIVLGEST